MTTRPDHHDRGSAIGGSDAATIPSTFRTAALLRRTPTTFQDATAGSTDTPVLTPEALTRSAAPVVAVGLDIDEQWDAFERATAAPTRGRRRGVFSRTTRPT